MDGHERVPLIQFAPKNKNNMERAGSCVTDPQVSALDALKCYDHSFLCNLLTDDVIRVDLNKAYPAEKHKTLLHIAVDNEDLESASMLMKAGADPNIVNPVLKTTPLHVAARKGNWQILNLLLSYRNTNVNALTDDGKTALHLLVKKCDAKNHSKIFPCIQLLLAKGIQVDKADRAGQNTALSLAATETKNLEVVKILASHGANLGGSCGAGRIRDILAANFGEENTNALLKESQQMLTDQSGGSSASDRLLRLLNDAQVLLGKQEDEAPSRMAINLKEFEEMIRLLTSASDLTNASPNERNLVQVACDYGLAAHLRSILSCSVDPNLHGEGTLPPLLMAAKAGHYDVIRILRQHRDRNESDPTVATIKFLMMDPKDKSTVLHLILSKPLPDDITFVKNEDGVDKYEKCLEATLANPTESFKKEIRQIINLKDMLGNTALHYATQLWPQTVVRQLLEYGANIGVKNKYDEVPIAQILPETMESFLNEHCMTSSGNVTNANFEISLKFDFLEPPQDQVIFKAAEGSTPKVSNWTEKDAESLTAKNNYDDVTSGQDDLPLPEMEGLWYMSQSKKHQHLLKHPVIAAFLFMKWQRMGPAYNKNLLFYLIFVGCVTAYIFALFSGRAIRDDGILTETCQKNESDPDAVRVEVPIAGDVTVLWYALTILLGILTFRESLQFGIAPRRYFFSFENILEVALIGLTAALLFHGPIQCHVAAKREISAVIIVLSWSELVTMVGKHPRLTFINIYVTMFYKVLSTFILFLTWYSFYIIAFGLGFYILLHNDLGKEPENGEEPEKEVFNSIGTTLVKTVAMFIGELEFGDLPIDSTLGYLFLISFIFLIVVVLMNLLNGLAVSDTGVIRQEAEIHAYKSQVGIVSYMESMMLGDPFNFLANWPKYIWLKHVPTCSVVGGGRLYKVPRIRNFFHTLTGARDVMLFHNGGLKNNEVKFFPNGDTFHCSQLLPICRCCRRPEDDTDLPEAIVESAKNLIISKNKDLDVDQNVQKLESRLERVENLLVQLLKKQKKEI